LVDATDVKILSATVPVLFASLILGCAPTATSTQHSLPPQKDSVPIATPNDPESLLVYIPDQWATQAREIALLETRFSLPIDKNQNHPRRDFVGVNVREYAFARYVEDWVTKIERVGNLNYPEAARRQEIFGSAMLTVSIYDDGRIEAVEIVRSSGSKILDEAAVRIVELAAPYARFSEEMRKKTDILSITRTWTFTRSNRLSDGK
jgi:protein TonB